MDDLTAEDWAALLAIPDEDYFPLREAVVQEGTVYDLDAIEAEVLRRWRLRQEEENDGPPPAA
jgi:hypothetical protein